MAELCKKTQYIILKRPYILYSHEERLWKIPTGYVKPIDLKSGMKYYKETYILKKYILGFEYIPDKHTIVLLLQGSLQNETIQFEDEESYNKGCAILTADVL